MKIALIQPKMRKRPMDTDLKTHMAPPLGLLTILKLTPDGHEARLINENVEKLDFGVDCNLVGITVTLDVMPRAIEIAQQFRRRGIPVVAGGIHVTGNPDSCLPHFDAVCVGPAERVWARIVRDAEAGTLQRVYCDADGFRGDEIASPAYDRVDRSRYLYTNVVSTSRGCPNRCSFCYNSSPNAAYILRPIDDVLADIRALGTRHVLFIDDNFIGAPARTRELLERTRGMGLKWSAAVTADVADDPELLDMMAETGCQSLFIGLESINDASLKSVNKKNRFEKYERLVCEIHRRGIMINASMVFGLDGDGPDVFGRTLEWLVEHRIETLTSHILTPYPGTALHRHMEAEGRIADHDLSKYNTAHVVFEPRGMTAEQLHAGYLWIYREFYSFKNILRRMPDRGARRRSYILFNLFYRKFGGFTSLLSRAVSMRAVGRFAARIACRIR
ncbi:MAG: B12-binding domain-containing radical SAM protein [Clostridiales bacterium]|jgi:radical SAM superfamily enzyme YgiQ (UPF0313 family)|nr:B12-binding domain-containing radical SAM protein [Clostridiales bacterium]